MTVIMHNSIFYCASGVVRCRFALVAVSASIIVGATTMHFLLELRMVQKVSKFIDIGRDSVQMGV